MKFMFVREKGVSALLSEVDTMARHYQSCPAPDLVLQLCLHLLGVGALVEVQVASEDLISSLSGQHHLDAHSLVRANW
jgi:hypothetical protein